MSIQQKVSVVIANYNGERFLEPCLYSIQQQTYPNVETIVVDNASTDSSVQVVGRVAPAARVLSLEENRGFAGGINAGIRIAHGDWIAVLNSDCEASPSWIEESMAAADRNPGAVFLASRVLEHDRKHLYSAGDCFLRGGIGYRRGQQQRDQPQYRREMEIFSASGAAALFRKPNIDEKGGFDEDYFAYLEDVDLGLRFQASGETGYYVPKAEVMHHGGGTSGGEFSSMSVRLRTRNSLLLLAKSLPAGIVWRCLPMILILQASWLARVLVRGKIWSYLRGLGGAMLLLPRSLRSRKTKSLLWKENSDRLWAAILRSETIARGDFLPGSKGNSMLLRCYFRMFRASSARLTDAA